MGRVREVSPFPATKVVLRTFSSDNNNSASNSNIIIITFRR